MRDFIPHNECTVASGDCFHQGRCLDQCRTRSKAAVAEAVKEHSKELLRLEARIVKLERALGERK